MSIAVAGLFLNKLQIYSQHQNWGTAGLTDQQNWITNTM